MKSLLTLLLCSIFSIASYSQTEINPFEFMIMEGSWAGTFTYIDESSHKPTTQEFDSEVSINFQAGEIYWKKIFYPDYTVQKDTIYFTDFTFNDIDMNISIPGMSITNGLKSKPGSNFLYSMN